MEFVPIAAGPFVAHQTKLDGQRVLVLEDAGGRAFGAIREKLNEQRVKRSSPKTAGWILEAAGGSWFLPPAQKPVEHHEAVLEAAGSEAGGIDRVSRTVETLQLPAGDLTWEHHTTRPQYRINGLFGASRTSLHTFAAGVSRQPFKGEITDALALDPTRRWCCCWPAGSRAASSTPRPRRPRPADAVTASCI